MAKAGMARWRSKAPPGEGDEVQRSLELLDRVLSEFDDLENGNISGEGAASAPEASPAPTPPEPPASSTPEDESPSLGGHQSEDDGYMSMNGRRAKFVLGIRPVPDEDLPPAPDPLPEPPPASIDLVDFPPPPEEAERIISTLLPRVSPGNSAKKSSGKKERTILNDVGGKQQPHLGCRVTTATQTTLPKTRHQRPYGWQNGLNQVPFHLQDPPPPQLRFASLPYDGGLQHVRFPPPWLPPRTVPGVLDRHREVRRCGSGETEDPPPPPPLKTLDENTDFSDDSLEEGLPPPPPLSNTSKRNSIAWEVPLDEALLTPGSTKVVGRRRRRSTDHSSSSSINKHKDLDDWPDPPVSTEDEAPSPFSDSYYDSSQTNDLDDSNFVPPIALAVKQHMTHNGTYVIRKGHKRERKPLPPPDIPQIQPVPRHGDLKRCSSTFDNIKSLIKEGIIEGLSEPPQDFQLPTPPGLVRVVSLPTLSTGDRIDSNLQNCCKEMQHRSKTEVHRISRPHELAVTVEEDEDSPYGYDGLPDQLADLRMSEEERNLIAQLERDNSGQFLDTSAESLLLGDSKGLFDFKNKDNKVKDSEREKKHSSLDSKSGNKCNHVKPSSYRNCSSHDRKEHTKESLSSFSLRVGDGLTKSQEELLENVRQDVNFKKRVDGFRSRSEEYARTMDCDDIWLTAAELNHPRAITVMENGERCRADEFRVNVEILQHEFPPLPPSPVEEDDDEYSEILSPSPVQTPKDKSDTLSDPFYRSLEPSSCDSSGSRFKNRPCPPEPPPHHDPMNSLKTRSMDAGFSRGHRNHSSSRRDIPSERRTLPSELPGTLKRRTFQKRSNHSPQSETLQTSCSLPETPIFARGCDIPRTPHRRAPDVPGGARTAPRPVGLNTTGFRRVGNALVGAELLRLAGGPGRGWYPRHRHPRPASIENLDRLNMGHSPGHLGPNPWEPRDARKPLTLPPNLSPKFFHRSPREALRRVTSLLIRKGGNPKEGKKEAMSPTGTGEDGTRQKRGFFKNFWKRSRHYSLEQQ